MGRLLSRLLLFFGLLLVLKSLSWKLYQLPQWTVTCSRPYKSVQFDSLRTTYNAVFVGSSRTFMSIIPGRFDSQTGQALHSYNYGIAGFFAPHSFQLTESLLRRSDLALRYVFVELSLPSSSLPEEPFQANPLAEVSYRVRLWRLYKELTSGPTWDAWGNDYTFALLSPSFCLYQSMPIFFNRFTVARPKKTELRGYDFVPSRDGYLRDKQLRLTNWRTDTVSLCTSHQLARRTYTSASTEVPNATYWADVARLLRLAEARKIHLMFYLPNRLQPSEAHVLPAIFNRIPTANRLQIRVDTRFDALFTPACSLDKMHLNHTGAQQYTDLLVEAFKRATGPVDPGQTTLSAR